MRHARRNCSHGRTNWHHERVSVDAVSSERQQRLYRHALFGSWLASALALGFLAVRLSRVWDTDFAQDLTILAGNVLPLGIALLVANAYWRRVSGGNRAIQDWPPVFVAMMIFFCGAPLVLLAIGAVLRA